MRKCSKSITLSECTFVIHNTLQFIACIICYKTFIGIDFMSQYSHKDKSLTSNDNYTDLGK